MRFLSNFRVGRLCSNSVRTRTALVISPILLGLAATFCNVFQRQVAFVERSTGEILLGPSKSRAGRRIVSIPAAIVRRCASTRRYSPRPGREHLSSLEPRAFRCGVLEPDGLMVAVQGARRDTYPSGMARDVGGGMKVYVLHPGLRGRREDLVETLDDALSDKLATVDEERAFHDAWIVERGKQ